MPNQTDPGTRPAAALKLLHVLVAFLATAGVTACGPSPVGPSDERASMRVASGDLQATALGERLLIEATVVTARGEAIRGAAVHWDVSAPGVLEALGNGSFLVLNEGVVQVTAVWPKDPSVRATVAVNVDAGILATACIARIDQTAPGAPRKCAQRRLLISASLVPTVVAAADERLRATTNGGAAR